MRIDTSLTTENPDTDATLMGLFTFLTDGGKGYSAMINPEKLVVQVIIISSSLFIWLTCLCY
jgi:hypothetical protein